MKSKKSLPKFNVFVFSLPRCGSSMTTGICEKLGVNMIYTSEDPEKRQKMQERYKKRLGEYIPNEHFYEITENQFSNWLKVIKTPYAGCKVIIPVNGMRWDGVLYQPSKVLMMMRDPEEIRQSQEAFYSRQSDAAYIRTALVQEQLKLKRVKEAYDLWKSGKYKKIPTIEEWYEMGNKDKPLPRKKMFDFMLVEYQDILKNPREQVQKIADFIESPNSIDEAVASIKPDRNRFKKEELEEGI